MMLPDGWVVGGVCVGGIADHQVNIWMLFEQSNPALLAISFFHARGHGEFELGRGVGGWRGFEGASGKCFFSIFACDEIFVWGVGLEADEMEFEVFGSVIDFKRGGLMVETIGWIVTDEKFCGLWGIKPNIGRIMSEMAGNWADYFYIFLSVGG